MVHKKHLIVILMIMVCLLLTGCATIGAVGTGLFKGFTGLIGLVLKALHGLADLANKIPRPPGVF